MSIQDFINEFLNEESQEKCWWVSFEGRPTLSAPSETMRFLWSIQGDYLQSNN